MVCPSGVDRGGAQEPRGPRVGQVKGVIRCASGIRHGAAGRRADDGDVVPDQVEPVLGDRAEVLDPGRGGLLVRPVGQHRDAHRAEDDRGRAVDRGDPLVLALLDQLQVSGPAQAEQPVDDQLVDHAVVLQVAGRRQRVRHSCSSGSGRREAGRAIAPT